MSDLSGLWLTFVAKADKEWPSVFQDFVNHILRDFWVILSMLVPKGEIIMLHDGDI